MNIETPCILIDMDIMKKNINDMAGKIKANGCSLRPHVKTHKMPEIAKMQLDGGAVGVTVAKVSEAEVMSEHGIKDIFIAYPIIGRNKINRVLELSKKIRLIVGVDSLYGANELNNAAKEKGQIMEIRMEVDTGLRRTGVPYGSAENLAAEVIKLDNLNLTGIYTFRGLVYNGKATLDREKAGLEEGELMVDLANRLRKNGINIKEISAGSTPTAEYAAKVPGITEVRPGTYVFYDTMQHNMNVCSWDQCAAKVLVTVISRPTHELAIIDGGSKTFSTDAPLGVFPHYLVGNGKVVEDENLVLERLTEEHGMISVNAGAKELNIGDKLQIIPNHVCSAINLHNKVYFIENGDVIKEVKVAARGMLY